MITPPLVDFCHVLCQPNRNHSKWRYGLRLFGIRTVECNVAPLASTLQLFLILFNPLRETNPYISIPTLLHVVGPHHTFPNNSNERRCLCTFGSFVMSVGQPHVRARRDCNYSTLYTQFLYYQIRMSLIRLIFNGLIC